MKAYIIYERLFNAIGERLLVGGIETYLMNLAKVFIQNDITPIIVQQASVSFKKNVNGIEIRGHIINKGNIYKKLYSTILHEIQDEDFLVWGLDRCAVKVPHERTISIQHGIPFDYYQIEMKSRQIFDKLGLGRLLKSIQRRNAIKAFEVAKYKVCVDYNFWNWYRTFCMPKDEDNITVIPNFATIDSDPNILHHNDVIKVVFARRFVRMRGVEVMIKVAEHYINNPLIQITFAGEGPYLSKIEELQRLDPTISITKYSPEDAVSFHKQFDIAVIPTIASEGTSLSLLEAMSAGTAVICTCVGGMTNIILDGYNGLYVRPGNVNDIISAIDILLKDKYMLDKISRNGVDTVRSSFSHKVWSERWSSLIKEIVEQSEI